MTLQKAKPTKRNKPQVVMTLDPRIIHMMDQLCELRTCSNRTELATLLIREEHERVFGFGGKYAPGQAAGVINPATINPPASLNEVPRRAVQPARSK